LNLLFFLYWSAAALIISVWILYPILLWLLVNIRKSFTDLNLKVDYQAVSVIVAAHNEAVNLSGRITNIFESDYPASKIEVVIVSDGSSDDTPSVIDKLKENYPRINLVNIEHQGGRSNAHNVAIKHCTAEILVFTDAETIFEPTFLKKIIESFQRPDVGFSSGVLKYRNQSSNSVTESAGIYWRFENFLREFESSLGVFVFGSGACCAVRRSLFRKIPPVGDVDFTTPLDVVLQGRKCVHVPDAIAYDDMPNTPEREFNARVRMTAKNLYGTIERWGLKGVFAHPIYTLVIFFHKIGRWLMPFLMIALFFSNIMLLSEGHVYSIFFVLHVVFYLLAFAGYKKLNVPLARSSYSFCLANIGFFIGVLKAATGRVPNLYKPVSQS